MTDKITMGQLRTLDKHVLEAIDRCARARAELSKWNPSPEQAEKFIFPECKFERSIDHGDPEIILTLLKERHENVNLWLTSRVYRCQIATRDGKISESTVYTLNGEITKDQTIRRSFRSWLRDKFQ